MMVYSFPEAGRRPPSN